MKFQINYSYNVPEWGTIELEAETADIAEFEARNQIHDLYPEITDLVIDEVKPIGV